jgi:hypothetical protein
MSIPDRLWRVAKGYWTMAGERIAEAEAQAAAYQELEEVLRRAPAPPPAQNSRGEPVLPAPPRASSTSGERDPLEACYEILKLKPGAGCDELDAAYQARLEEIKPERYVAGTPERMAMDSRAGAVRAAYDKLRDALNPVETRFERLEF